MEKQQKGECNENPKEYCEKHNELLGLEEDVWTEFFIPQHYKKASTHRPESFLPFCGFGESV